METSNGKSVIQLSQDSKQNKSRQLLFLKASRRLHRHISSPISNLDNWEREGKFLTHNKSTCPEVSLQVNGIAAPASHYGFWKSPLLSFHRRPHVEAKAFPFDTGSSRSSRAGEAQLTLLPQPGVFLFAWHWWGITQIQQSGQRPSICSQLQTWPLSPAATWELWGFSIIEH